MSSDAPVRHLYGRLIERIFLDRYTEGQREVCFERSDIAGVAAEMGIAVPKNLGDVIYSFRYRTPLPAAVRDTAPQGEEWIIRSAGRARYCLVLTPITALVPSSLLTETRIPDATPGLISMYALSDEQALLAKLRYNRLIDVFTGITCYPLQSHLRTALPGVGQVETDELYVGIDSRGAHYVLPVQAKSGRERQSIVQIEQDFALCRHRFERLICIPIAAQFMQDDLIALFALEMTATGVAVSAERHYRLVPPDRVTPEELEAYRRRPRELWGS